MINRFIKFLSSMKFVVLLLLIFAFSIGYATFIENDFGTDSAKALIYNTWWFELLLIILGISLILNMIKHKVFRKEKLAILTFHLSFILILVGAAITRYTGYEGMMQINKGESKNTFISDGVFLQIKVHDKDNQYLLDKNMYLSGITKKFDHTPILKNLFSNYFLVSNSDLKNNFSISYSDFETNIQDSVSKEISGIILSSSSNSEKKGTELSVNEFLHKDIFFGKEVRFKDVNFTVNNIQDSSVNFIFENDRVSCVSDYNISVSTMPPTGEPLIFMSGTEFEIKKMSLLTIKGNKYMFGDFSYNQDTVSYSISDNMDNSGNNPNRTIDELVLEVKVGNKTKKVNLRGRKGIPPSFTKFQLEDLYFTLSYGPKYYTLPFHVRLDSAEVDKYPGSENPSSYASQVTVIDGDNIFPFRIFMNNILNYRGFRFYQSNIDTETKNPQWTGLSVNHDWWGTLITYIGYSLMLLGMILSFFFKKTRFNTLSKKLNKLTKSTLIILFSLFSFSGFSQSNHNYLDSIEEYKINEGHSEKFERLLIQHDGRVKPISTFSSEIIRKVSRSEKIYNQTPSQVLLGIICYPEIWSNIPLLKIQNEQLLTELNSKNDLVSFNSLLNDDGIYIYYEETSSAFNKAESERSKREKELLKLWERINIFYSLKSTQIENSSLTIFPVKNIQKWTTKSPLKELKIPNEIVDSNRSINGLNLYFDILKFCNDKNNFEAADKLLIIIQKYQIDNGGDLIPSKWKLDLEIMYNKLNVFHKLFYFYFFSGLMSLILIIFQMFYNNKWINKSIRIIKWIIISGIFIHTLGLIARWIISNHAPWTNGYEAMIYTVWATMLAGLIFSRKSDLTLSATTLVSSMLLLFTWISYLDPTITNVVPVLNSYWLMIHVSVIVSSYGFLIMGGFLGLLSLILMIFKSNKNKEIINSKISELTIINEKTLIIGLFMLTIGTFLGGVWANESWGRYWGWDPKETWALVSILVYAFILHMRFVPGLQGKYTFNLASVIGVYSVLMTYFGVNYLLSGLHSYAAGDKVSIPMSVWVSVLIVIIIAILAKLNNNKK
ncbi:MAG: c-type cytochrome biogenesis protein CcsB [Flavobacteriales bacterium]|nr:c-type cytochrome biogenesis protein CcsB [Flavobacteriales bacterium]